MDLFTRQVPFSVGHEDMEWCSHEDLHLEPPPSHGGVHGSYTLRASNWCGMSELRRHDLFGRQACCCYINAALKKVAEVGIAPT